MVLQIPIARPVRTYPFLSILIPLLIFALSFQNVAAVTSDLWPSMSNLLAAPRQLTGRTPTARIRDTRPSNHIQQESVAVCLHPTVCMVAIADISRHLSACRCPSAWMPSPWKR